jgi:Rrf2 family transcriptional regulator, iron-sulfur cluster assembly transcription factor
MGGGAFGANAGKKGLTKLVFGNIGYLRLFLSYILGAGMRLTKAGEYAIRCALFLSLKGPGVVSRKKEIARAMDIPDPFLAKIAQQLARAGIIEIVQGSKGGYRLLVAAENLTMLDVVEAVIGEIYLNDCVIRPDSCRRTSSCAIHRIWEEARNQLRETLGKADFKSILADRSCTLDLLKTMKSDA